MHFLMIKMKGLEMVKWESLRINMYRITHTGKSVNFSRNTFERRTDFPMGKIYLSLFREIKVAQHTFRLRLNPGNSLKEINFFQPKCTGPPLERLRLKSPETLSAYSTGDMAVHSSCPALNSLQRIISNSCCFRNLQTVLTRHMYSTASF